MKLKYAIGACVFLIVLLLLLWHLYENFGGFTDDESRAVSRLNELGSSTMTYTYSTRTELCRASGIITREHFECYGKIRYLGRLAFVDVDFDKLETLENLHNVADTVIITRGNITNAKITSILAVSHNLKSVHFYDCNVDDSTLDILQKSNSINSVSISGTKITGERLAQFRKQRPDIRVMTTLRPNS